jgi:signal recognition particle GTPase
LLDSKRNFAYIIAKEYYEKEEATMENRIPSDTILVREARRAVSAELKKKRALNKPIAEFDPKAKRFIWSIAMAKEKSLDQPCREGDTVNAASKKPEIIVFAGPNGSGKSTITKQLLSIVH